MLKNLCCRKIISFGVTYYKEIIVE